MNTTSWQDSRGFFMLPQQIDEAAYYVYGTPIGGRAQYAHPNMLSFIFALENRWAEFDNRKIGIGNISLAEGKKFPPHRSHRSGLEVDIRPIRKDGKDMPVRYQDKQYDRPATALLVQLMWQTGMVSKVGFNDLAIPLVKHIAGHDDHLHIELK